MNKKQCSKCHKLKMISEFHKQKCHSDNLTSQCKKCRSNSEHDLYITNPYYYWVNNTIIHHRYRKFNIQINRNWLISLTKQTKKCYICDCNLNWNTGFKKGKPQNNSPTLDSIDNSKNLTNNNIQIVCYRCNSTKRDRTMNEFIEYCKNVYKKFGDR